MSSLTFHSVVNEEDLLQAFFAFVQRFHAEEALLFWLEVEVFRNRNWKAARLLGLEPACTRKSSQRKLDEAQAARMGIPLDQLYLIREADFVFDTFVSREGALWTCLDAVTVGEITHMLFDGDPAQVSRTLFDKAQNRVFAEMNQDLMPRFCKELDAMRDGDGLRAKQRYDELRALRPETRKTAVSTALAFSFVHRASFGGQSFAFAAARKRISVARQVQLDGVETGITSSPRAALLSHSTSNATVQSKRFSHHRHQTGMAVALHSPPRARDTQTSGAMERRSHRLAAAIVLNNDRSRANSV